MSAANAGSIAAWFAALGLDAVPPLERDLDAALTQAIDNKTKPPGSLGRIECVARTLGLIQRSVAPRIVRPTVIVFAGDHGIAREGVSPYPQAVTAQMVRNFVAGGAAINVFARAGGIALEIVDAGVIEPLDLDGVVQARIGPGTRNFAVEPAMTRE
jgi:nicotinate-nucleotide--dimethylbenzimidazole phosphoribosyltransferase